MRDFFRLLTVKHKLAHAICSPFSLAAGSCCLACSCSYCSFHCLRFFSSKCRSLYTANRQLLIMPLMLNGMSLWEYRVMSLQITGIILHDLKQKKDSSEEKSFLIFQLRCQCFEFKTLTKKRVFLVVCYFIDKRFCQFTGQPCRAAALCIPV